ncbi:MAG: hypothetical protein MUF51_01285, partial [Vicinamibacteria bacterium]|nr:hypothetical protein [Vicinamibacteria bacterium]
MFFRLNVLPFIGVFFMGVIGAKASYPIIRWLCFLSGPLGFLRAEAFRVDRLHFHSGGMTGPLGSIVGAAFCLFLLAQEQRRKSPTLLLWRNRLYRVGLLAFMA